MYYILTRSQIFLYYSHATCKDISLYLPDLGGELMYVTISSYQFSINHACDSEARIHLNSSPWNSEQHKNQDHYDIPLALSSKISTITHMRRHGPMVITGIWCTMLSVSDGVEMTKWQGRHRVKALPQSMQTLTIIFLQFCWTNENEKHSRLLFLYRSRISIAMNWYFYYRLWEMVLTHPFLSSDKGTSSQSVDDSSAQDRDNLILIVLEQCHDGDLWPHSLVSKFPVL